MTSVTTYQFLQFMTLIAREISQRDNKDGDRKTEAAMNAFKLIKNWEIDIYNAYDTF